MMERDFRLSLRADSLTRGNETFRFPKTLRYKQGWREVMIRYASETDIREIKKKLKEGALGDSGYQARRRDPFNLRRGEIIFEVETVKGRNRLHDVVDAARAPSYFFEVREDQVERLTPLLRRANHLFIRSHDNPILLRIGDAPTAVAVKMMIS